MKFKIILTTIPLAAIMLLAGCSQKINTLGPSINTDVTQQPQSVENAAPAIENTLLPPDAAPQIMNIADLLKQSSEYVDREVIVQGKIVQECGAGCWFNLKDDTGIIFVDLAPSNIVIPQKVGSQATVIGKFGMKKGIAYVIGTQVEF